MFILAALPGQFKDFAYAAFLADSFRDACLSPEGRALYAVSLSTCPEGQATHDAWNSPEPSSGTRPRRPSGRNGNARKNSHETFLSRHKNLWVRMRPGCALRLRYKANSSVRTILNPPALLAVTFCLGFETLRRAAGEHLPGPNELGCTCCSPSFSGLRQRHSFPLAFVLSLIHI